MMRSFVVAALLVSGSSLAHAAPDVIPTMGPRTISVHAKGVAKAVPDYAVVVLAVETDNDDVVVAKRENDDRTRRIVQAAKAAGVADRDIQTGQVSIQQRYLEGRLQRGVTMRKSVTVNIKDLSKFETVVAALISAGANRLDGIDLRTSRLEKLREDAQRAAMKAAKAKAERMAGEIGTQVGRVRSITESADGVMPFANARVAMAVADSAPSEGGFSAGEIEIDADVDVVFDLVER